MTDNKIERNIEGKLIERMTVREAAQFLGISRSQIYRAIKKKQLPVRHAPFFRGMYISLRDLVSWVWSCKNPSIKKSYVRSIREFEPPFTATTRKGNKEGEWIHKIVPIS